MPNREEVSFCVAVICDTSFIDANYLRISVAAKTELFSSFEGLSLEELDIEGIEIPTSIEFVTSFAITLIVAISGIHQTNVTSSIHESLSLLHCLNSFCVFTIEPAISIEFVLNYRPSIS